MNTQPQPAPHFAVCIRNEGNPESLDVGKLYQVLPDPKAERLEMVRVIDESGEDYLYPQEYFLEVSLSPQQEETLRTVLRLAS